MSLKKLELGRKVSLKDYTTIKIGGEALYFLTLHDTEELLALYQDFGNNFYLLGGGSKLLIRDQWLDTPVAKLGKEFDYIKEDGECIEVGGATAFSSLMRYCLKNKLSGLESLVGIPALVAGMVAINASAFGGEIFSHLVKVETFDSGTIRQLQKQDLSFGYRQTSLKGTVVLRVWFRLNKEVDKENRLKLRVKDFLERRKASQPYSLPGEGRIYTCGCIFKNPQRFSAGRLIEDCGLKGLKKNYAYVSPKHANFIINSGNATYDDVSYLIEIIKEKVAASYGILLEEEIIRWT